MSLARLGASLAPSSKSSSTFAEAIAEPEPVESEPARDVEPQAQTQAADDALDASWVTSFTGEVEDNAQASQSVDALLSIPGAVQPQAQPQPQPAAEAEAVEPVPAQPVAVAQPLAVPAQPQPTDDLVSAISDALQTLQTDASSSSGELGQSGVAAAPTIKLTTPHEANTDASAIAANVLALIQHRMQSNAVASTASMGSGGGGA